MMTKFDRYLKRCGLTWNQYRSRDTTDRAMIRIQSREYYGQAPDVHDLKILGITPDETIPKDTEEVKRRSLESQRLAAEAEKKAKWQLLKEKIGYRGSSRGMPIFNTPPKDISIPTNDSLYH